MHNSIDDFLSSHTFSDETKSSYRSVLELLVEHPFSEWSASDLLSFVARDNWGNSRRYVALCASRKFIAWSCGNQHPALSARVKRIKAKRGRSLSMSQITELLASFNTMSAIGSRDLALAALAIDTGLRASELARVQLADVDLEHHTLQAIVKGGQWGFAVFSGETAHILEHWLKYRQPADGVNALFVSLRANKTHGRQLTRDGLKSIFKKWGLHQGYKLSPHDARRTFGNITTSLGSPQPITMAAGRWQSEDAFRRYTQDVQALSIEPYLPITHALRK